MNRLIEKTVFSGFVIPCRFATWPTRISPSLVNPTTEGVSRLPSWLAMTVGLPPSTTATTEFVVPRSMPITFAMSNLLLSSASVRSRASSASALTGSSRRRRRESHLENVDLDLPGLDLFGLRKLDSKDAVPVGRVDLLRLDRHRELHRALELSVDPL